jgi:hypothetical protein
MDLGLLVSQMARIYTSAYPTITLEPPPNSWPATREYITTYVNGTV